MDDQESNTSPKINTDPLKPQTPRFIAVPSRNSSSQNTSPARQAPLAAPQEPVQTTNLTSKPSVDTTISPGNLSQQSTVQTPLTTAPMQPAPQPPQASPQQILETAAKNDKQRTIMKRLKSLFSFLLFVITVLVAATLINTFIFQSYYVDGTSMTPTLQNEDRLIIDKIPRTIAAIQGKTYIPNRGDIVVLDSTILDQYGHEEQLIKRVIGLPGDTVIIKDGVVTIKNSNSPQGFNADEQLGLHLTSTFSDVPIEVTVPESSLYVLGDNRGINGSFDSRAFGVVSSSNVQGRLALRIFPFDHTQSF